MNGGKCHNPPVSFKGSQRKSDLHLLLLMNKDKHMEPQASIFKETGGKDAEREALFEEILPINIFINRTRAFILFGQKPPI